MIVSSLSSTYFLSSSFLPPPLPILTSHRLLSSFLLLLSLALLPPPTTTLPFPLILLLHLHTCLHRLVPFIRPRQHKEGAERFENFASSVTARWRDWVSSRVEAQGQNDGSNRNLKHSRERPDGNGDRGRRDYIFGSHSPPRAPELGDMGEVD